MDAAVEIAATAHTLPDPACYVAPSSYAEQIASAELFIQHGKPVLLCGPTGCGKSALLHHLAARQGRSASRDLITIQLCKDADGRALLGSYHCTEIGGEFKWVPGILARVVMNSCWVILDDLDSAPMDVVSVLLTLIQTGALNIPEIGSTIQAGDGFRIFATLRTHDPSIQQSHVDPSLFSHFKRIYLEKLPSDEILMISRRLFPSPSMQTFLPELLRIFSTVTNAAEIADMDARRCVAHRLISLRDFLKSCQRISSYLSLNSRAYAEILLQDVCDCFVAFVPGKEARLALARQLGVFLGLPSTDVDYNLGKRQPVVVDSSPSDFRVGRVSLAKVPLIEVQPSTGAISLNSRPVFSLHPSACRLLESLCMGVAHNEALLLVGETGTGKTTCVQYLAEKLGRKLHVINLSQQAELTDILGGYKPIEMGRVFAELQVVFLDLFRRTFSLQQNVVFIERAQKALLQKDWTLLATAMRHIVSSFSKRKNADEKLVGLWTDFAEKLAVVERQLTVAKRSLLFTFLEGTLVTSYRSGEWVLLDEINLATPELLASLSHFIDNTQTSFLLIDRGDDMPIRRHPDFRLLACMNPATDLGKRDLPAAIRSRFTEIYCDDLSDRGEVRQIVVAYLQPLALNVELLEKVVELFFILKTLAETKMVDGVSHKPHYSLRTFTQALKFAVKNPMGKVVRSLYEGFCLSYLTQLSRESQSLMKKTIAEHLFGEVRLKHPDLSLRPPRPTAGRYELIEGYWIACGQLEPLVDEKYILTETVKSNLTEVARAVSDGQVPVLLQGETSIGKTSLITWLARATGNRCVRINNHEHTDLQDYLGSYQPNEDGKLVFCEGILVDAVRKGYWIILDELNLAPSDVLEALNRLLDANRELFITETQQIIRAHPHFMLFATQNPPGYYGGRKALSRAFRNRFIEMHFDEIPREELVKILQQRCDLPEAYAKKMISVMVDLQTLRKNSGIFAGKQGFITLRDLFRWAERYRLATVPAGNQFYDWSQHLAEHGFMLLAGRVRRTDDADVVKSVVEKHFKVSVSSEQLFGSFGALPSSISSQAVAQAFKNSHSEQLRHLVWTSNWQRLVVLAGTALQYGEAVLLVGDTGCGKTTVCQLYADLKQQPLLSVNCHMNTETADFLGGLRPARHSSASGALFEWNDGPLVAAMQQGAVFLLDEISLADDAVLERLNSLLEPERTVVLTEKGAAAAGGRLDVPEVCAAPDFRLVATMNPGGDFGKKELSPALRNRFTEIWCRNLNIPGDLRLVMEQNLWPEAGIMRGAFITAICEFIEWMVQQNNRLLISTRDVMSLIKFMNAFVCAPPEGLCRSLSGQPHLAYYHGCLTVFHSLHNEMDSERIGQFIGAQFHTDVFAPYFAELGIALPLDLSGELLVDKDEYFGVAPFVVKKNPNAVRAVPVSYSFDADSVKKNLLRIIRGMAVTKGVLLEGSPGIGKTSIITALARACGYDVVRINLSEQTDIAELFGADMPVCDASSEGLFAWRDGPFLQGLKRGSWILLDELNLASQSVLEGLNACLDHRGEVFIPELNRTFTVDTQTTRIFACQNPLAQGAGRKGLPKSFLNRFTQVLMEALSDGDLLEICCRMYPGVEKVTVERMLLFNAAVEEAVGAGQEGRPWEFNLRDVMRWCDLLLEREGNDDDGKYQAALVDLLYAARFRTVQDRQLIWQLAQDILGISATSRSVPARQFLRCEITESYLHLGVVSLERGKCPTADSVLDLQLLQSQSALLEKLAFCVKHNFVSLLVGGAGVGKAAAVQLLAALCGQRLETMYLNSALDATELLGGFQQVSQAPSASAGRFEWRDSVVVRAIRDGGWLLLDGANLCSAAVLDRLNSVLEPHGELLLSECGTVGEAVPCIKPHPNFRLFLVMDRKYGELSRAMRNRAIEIFVPALLNQRDEETLAAQLGVPLNDIGVVLKGLHHQIPSKDLSVAALRDVVEETMMRRSIGASLDGALSKAVCSVVTSLHSLANDTVALYVNGDPVQELVHPPFPVVVRDIMSHPAQTNTLRNRRVVEFIAQQLHRMETQPVVLATCLEIFFLTAFSAEAQLRKISAEEFLSTSSVLFPMQQMEMEKWPERPETRRWLVSWIFRTSSNAAPNLSLSSIQRDVQEHFSIVQQWTHQEIQRAALGIESFVAGMWLRSLAILLKHPLDRSLLSLIWMLFLKNLHPSDEIIEKSAGKLDIQLLITQDKERIRFRRCFDTVRPFATENEFLKHRILSECRFSADSVENGKTWNIFQKSLEICDSDGVSDFRSIFNMDLSAVFVKKIITGNTVDFIEKITENCRFFPDAVRETVMYSVFDLSVKSVEFDVGKSVASEIFPWEFSLPTVNRILHEIVKKLIFGNSEKVTVALKDVDDVVQRFGELRSVFWRRLQCRQLKMSEKEQVNFFLNFWNGRLQTDATCPQELWKILADNGNFEGDVGKLEKNILEGVEMLVAENERRSVAADWMALGICGMKVFCPPTVDPVQKVRVKRQCLAQQEDDCQTSLHVVDEYFTRLYGSADPENYDPLVSEPYHAHLTFCRRKLAKLQALPEVYRPANSTYFAMVQDAGYVRENCLKTGSELSRALAEKDVSKRKKVVDQLGSWLLSVVAVVDELKRKYLVYRDILLLFLSSLHQFIHGWRLIFHDLRESIFLQESEISDTVRQTVQHLSPLSNPDFISVAKRLWTSRLDILRFFRHSTGEMVATELKLIRFILRLIQLHQKIAGSSLIANKLTDAVMRRFALIWSEIEEQKKREVVEKETLYTFAGETVFPTYQNVFSDVYKKTDAETIEKIQPEVAAENRIILTENLCSDLIELHSAVVNERTGVPTPELMRILSAEGLEMKFLLEKQAAGMWIFRWIFLEFWWRFGRRARISMMRRDLMARKGISIAGKISQSVGSACRCCGMWRRGWRSC
ncbi:midasin-like isoform X2 [Paramacrobiotus metropolitanus]|uniref:midasin-like isoform X2 n=1 Tax=Paramacrobiotus metropolitanus TaxID=2943436 RepID=UPI0024461611|nr:midasin-like isoform X2 [Paramacrobiotus metropolitanus]